MDDQNVYRKPASDVSNDVLLCEMQCTAQAVTELQQQTKRILTCMEKVMETQTQKSDDLQERILSLKQTENSLQEEKHEQARQIAVLETQLKQLIEASKTVTLWDDSAWNLGHVTTDMLRQLQMPLIKPPHLQTESFPLVCDKCQKPLYDSSNVCDDLYPLMPYDGKTVYCQSCFNNYIFPLRLQNAKESYARGKVYSRERSAKMRKSALSQKTVTDPATTKKES